MLSSSLEYRKALCSGNYLTFFGWVDFLVQQYGGSNIQLDADTTVDLLIYEWLTHGFCAEDIQGMVVLYAVYEKESKPLREKLAYSFIALSNALFTCMAYQKLDLYNASGWQKKMGCAEIVALIKNASITHNNVIYNETLSEVCGQFFEQVGAVDNKKVEAAYKSISAITEPRYVMQEYTLLLERAHPEHDELYLTRLSVAKSLVEYLQQQVELTPDVSNEIEIFINAIRAMQPAAWEEKHLCILSPPTMVENTWRWVADMGTGFFRVILQVDESDDLGSASQPEPTV